MTLFTESDLRKYGQIRVAKSTSSADRILRLDENDATSTTTFDIFLSHSLKDAEVILGVKTLLENQGLSVYVDWIVDSTLDRSNVTAKTASHLRTRMKQSKSMIYVHSKNSPDSKWMPWELGFFDGSSKPIAIFPVAQSSGETFGQQEFLGLYPYIDGIGTSLFVNKGSAPTLIPGSSASSYLGLREWSSKNGVKAGV